MGVQLRAAWSAGALCALAGVCASHAQDANTEFQSTVLLDRVQEALTASPTDDLFRSLDLAMEDGLADPTSDWSSRFTLASEHSRSLAWDTGEYELEFSAGDNWGFTLGVEGRNQSDVDWEAVRAGAFFDLTPRLRFGGELSLTNEYDDFGLRLNDLTEDGSRFALQSAFRF